MNIREDFSYLREHPDQTYVDSACVSLKPDVVLKSMNRYYEDFPACGGGRSGHELGRKTSESFEAARRQVQKFLGAKRSSEIIFTRNTTEGINLVARSFPFEHRCVLTSDKEHNSNYIPWLRLSKQGFKHLRVSTKEGVLDMDEYKRLLEEHEVDLVAINHVSNLDGIVNQVKELARIAHRHGARILVDGAQSAGHLPVDVRKLQADFFVCSGHKMFGPSGTGVLYGKREELVRLEPFLVGGDTVEDVTPEEVVWADLPHRFEAGLQDYAGVIGFGQACDYAAKLKLKRIDAHGRKLREALQSVLEPYGRLLGSADHRSSILTLLPENIDAHELSLLLGQHGIFVRSGTFCCHSWFHKHDVPAALRFSLHAYNTDEDIERIRKVLEGPLSGVLSKK